MARKLFCEISPLTYRLSVRKNILQRTVSDACLQARGRVMFARERTPEPLPFCVYRHRSLIRRRLGNVDMELQENKAVNLALAAPKADGILVRPGETFSFWHLVGSTSPKYGYRTGLVIKNGHTDRDTGGGMCQFTNLIHWLVLHTPLTVTEHHHHDGYDLFPDFGRAVPFGTGTSIMYNYLDYRFRNDTERDYQLLVWTDEEYLNGELRSSGEQPYRYHISAEDERFVREGGTVFRENTIWRSIIDPRTGAAVEKELLKKNHARVMYDTSGLEIAEER